VSVVLLQLPGPLPPGVGVAFTDRVGGVSGEGLGPLNLGRTDADDITAVATNFERVLTALDVDRVVTVHQVHGADVVVVDEAFLAGWGARHHLGEPGGAPPLPEADALVTQVRGVALCIRVADCVPVLLADPAAGIIGAAHAGRPGLAAGVLQSTVAAMRALGATDLDAWVGPHVCGGCYEVPADMRDDVARVQPAAYATTSWGTPALDLGAGSAAVLEAEGCRVQRLDACTRESAHLHSYRRDGARAGRQAGLVWLT